MKSAGLVGDFLIAETVAAMFSIFRFTIRDALWLTVVLVMGTAIFVTRSARENDRRSATLRASDQELEAINARYKAARGEFEWQDTRWHSSGSGRWSVSDACDAIERFAHATETRNDLETRVKDLASALEFAQY